MPGETWTDFLEAAADHLRASRQAVEQGAVSPDPPGHPDGPLPDELQPQVRRMALAYDQLALEVATRMADLDVRLTPPRVEPPSPAYYVDRRA